MSDNTGEFQPVLGKIVRSALTISIYVLFAPIFTILTYDILFNFTWISHAIELYATLPVLPIGRVIVFYTAGFIHALLAGCLVALLSPSIQSNAHYLAIASLIGAGIALIFPLPGPQIFGIQFWSGIGPKFIACFGLGSFFCAVLTLPFRAKPEPTP